jgi:hypothetical protein
MVCNYRDWCSIHEYLTNDLLNMFIYMEPQFVLIFYCSSDVSVYGTGLLETIGSSVLPEGVSDLVEIL